MHLHTLKLVKVLLFIIINILNFRIAEVALNYFNPTFMEPFLLSKTHLSGNGIFKTGLIIHGISACLALFICSLLVLFRIERVNVSFHRILGKTALSLVFGAVVPGGIILAFYASGGKIGKFLFFLLAVYTFSIAFLALKKAKAKQINQHKLLMTELLCILCSAILLRLLLMFFSTTNLGWELSYQLSISISWLPFAILFLFLKKRPSYNFRVE
jgi:hypothetical protein